MSESRLRYPMVMPCKFNYTDPWCCILSFYSVIVYMVFLECHVIIIVQGHTLCPVMEGWRNRPMVDPGDRAIWCSMLCH